MTSKTANAATLQEQTQDEKKKNNKDNNQRTDKRNIKEKDRKCLCLKMHLFEECVYICKSARPSE
jgi:hypothetical protein